MEMRISTVGCITFELKKNIYKLIYRNHPKSYILIVFVFVNSNLSVLLEFYNLQIASHLGRY